MTDVRSARRTAEKTARDKLAGTLISAVGDLAVAVTSQDQARNGVDAAQQHAAKHIASARREAAGIISAARANVDSADQAYADTYTAAAAAGWSTQALTDMGYTSPPSRKIRAATTTLPPTPNRSTPRVPTRVELPTPSGTDGDTAAAKVS